MEGVPCLPRGLPPSPAPPTLSNQLFPLLVTRSNDPMTLTKMGTSLLPAEARVQGPRSSGSSVGQYLALQRPGCFPQEQSISSRSQKPWRALACSTSLPWSSLEGWCARSGPLRSGCQDGSRCSRASQGSAVSRRGESGRCRKSLSSGRADTCEGGREKRAGRAPDPWNPSHH